MRPAVTGRIGLAMPIYEYRCDNDHRFEALQKFSDEPLTECEVCGAPARRVLHPVAIHFKGSGFYSTDYGRGKKSAAASESSKDGGSSSDSKSSSSDGKGSSSGGDSKPAKAAEG
jgi:putative FmdB family regulatory protein